MCFSCALLNLHTQLGGSPWIRERSSKTNDRRFQSKIRPCIPGLYISIWYKKMLQLVLHVALPCTCLHTCSLCCILQRTRLKRTGYTVAAGMQCTCMYGTCSFAMHPSCDKACNNPRAKLGVRWVRPKPAKRLCRLTYVVHGLS